MKTPANKPLDMKRVQKYVDGWFESRPLEEMRQSFDTALNGDLPPQTKAMRLNRDVGHRACQECVRLILAGDVDAGWLSLATGWRCRAIGIKLYVDRFDQLAKAHPDKAQKRDLPIGTLYETTLTSYLYDVMFAIAFQRDDFALFCGNRLLKNYRESDYLTEGKNDWDGDPEGPTLLRLFAKWRGEDLDLKLRKKVSFGDYAVLFDTWNDDKRFEQGVLSICELQAQDFRKRGDFLVTSPYYVVPTVVWALKRIRTDLGLSFPAQIDHPLMKTPFAEQPKSLNFNQPNPDISRVLEICGKQMTVSVPWEKA